MRNVTQGEWDMNNSYISRLFIYFFILIFHCTAFCQLTKSVESLNYYELIGLNGAQLTKEALDLVNANAEYIRETAVDKKEKIKERIENKFFADKIKAACQVARKNYEKQIAKAKEEAANADEFTQKEKSDLVRDLEKRLALTATACPFLLSPQQRRAYGKQRVKAPVKVSDSYLEAAGQAVISFFQAIQRGIEDAMTLAPDKKVVLNQLIGDALSQIEIPGPALKIFNQDLDIRSLSLLPRPMGPEVQYGIGFTGLMALNRVEVRLSVYIVQDIYGARKFSFIVDLPIGYKISDLFPTFNGLDAFTFPRAKFILANFEGVDQEGFPFKKGFNFGAMLDLSGPLKVLGELRDKASSLKSLVFESEPIIMSGVIPRDILGAEFTAQIPLRIGVDLQKIAAMPTTISQVINKITSDDFTLTISPVKPKKAIGQEGGKKFSEPVKPYIEILKAGTETEVNITKDESGEDNFVFKKVPRVTTLATIQFGYKVAAETGIRVTLGTQSEPIRLNVHGVVVPISKSHPQGLLTVGGSMKGMLELGWLGSIGDAVLDFDFDGATMAAAAAFGLPFTGMHISGKLGLGKPGEVRAMFSAAGGFSISAAAVPISFIIELAGENIQFGTLVNYAMQKAAQAKLLKAPIPADRIPTMTLHRAWGYCALNDTTIAGKLYRAGIGLQAEAQLFDHQAGFRIFMDDKFKLNGWGYMPPINLKVKGTEVFRLYGLEPTKGPRIAFSFDPQEPLKGMFGLQSTVHLPALGLKQLADFTWHGYLLNADFETEFPGFSVLFGIRMNIKEGTEILSPYDQAQREIEELVAQIDPDSSHAIAIRKLIQEAETLAQRKKFQEAVNILVQAKKLIPTNGTPQAQATITDFEKKARQAEANFRKLFAQASALLAEDTMLFAEIETSPNVATIKADFKYQQAIKLWQQAREDFDQLSIENIKTELNNQMRDGGPQMGYKLDAPTAQAIGKIIDQELPKVLNKYEIRMNRTLGQLSRAKRLLQESLPDKWVQAVYQQKIKAALAKIPAPPPLMGGFSELIKRFRTGKGDATSGDYFSEKQEIVTDSGAKWSKLYVKFGFKGDFAKFLNEQAVTTLRRVKENAIKNLDRLTEKVAGLQAQAVGSVETEINRVQETIAAKEKEISGLQTECRALPLYKQPKCRASIAAQQAILASRKTYLNALLRPGKAVVRGVAGAAGSVAKQLIQSKALRTATEAILEGAASGLEMIANGINFFNIIEARGEYSWEDMQSLRLPRLVRLVANVEIIPDSPMQIVLSDLQFDFKHPVQSAAAITRSLISTFIEQQQNKYLKYADILINE